MGAERERESVCVREREITSSSSSSLPDGSAVSAASSNSDDLPVFAFGSPVAGDVSAGPEGTVWG